MELQLWRVLVKTATPRLGAVGPRRLYNVNRLSLFSAFHYTSLNSQAGTLHAVTKMHHWVLLAHDLRRENSFFTDLYQSLRKGLWPLMDHSSANGCIQGVACSEWVA